MKKIYLSPSTQENNVGVGEYGTEEIVMNKIALVIEEILINHGIDVMKNKPSMSLTNVINESNKFKPHLHFALHSNAFNGVARGCEVFCYKLGIASEGEKAAKIIYDDLSKITPSPDRGLKQGYDFYGKGKHMAEVYRTDYPAVLAEISFHDNKNDALWILKSINLIGITIAKSILKYFKIEYIPVANNVTLLINEISLMNSKLNNYGLIINKLLVANKEIKKVYESF